MGSAAAQAGSNTAARMARKRMGIGRESGAVRRRGVTSLLRALRVVTARRLQLIGREETVTVGVELVEPLEEARRVGLRFGLAHATVAIGIEALPVVRTLLLVESVQLFRGDLAVAVRVDRVEVLRDARERRGFLAADHAVAVGIGGLESLETASPVAARIGKDEEGGRGEAGGGQGEDDFHGEDRKSTRLN